MRMQDALALVKGWLRVEPRPLREHLSRTIRGVQACSTQDGEFLYYVVSLEPAGFVIVAADDLIEPIIGFSAAGQFDASFENPLGALVGNDLPNRMAYARSLKNREPVPPSSRLKWRRLSGLASDAELGATPMPEGISSVSDVRIGPLVQSRWNQSTVSGAACFNYYTPIYEAGNPHNYPCGCVATAMAQLMRYYQYPTKGIGVGYFSILTNNIFGFATTRGGDSLGGPYDWASMVLVPSNSTAVQRQAIGALTYDAAVALYTQFTPSSSSAYASDIKAALTDVFQYANVIFGFNGMTNIGPGLTNMINPNLDAKCPVLFTIQGRSGSHAVVCDGYGYSGATLYHHLNMGWSGTSDAWYCLPTIDAYYQYTNVFGCVYNVFTAGAGEIISGRVLDANGGPMLGVAITAAQAGITNSAVTDLNGIYALAHLAANTTYLLSASRDGFCTASGSYTTGRSRDNQPTCGNYWGANFVLSAAPPPVVPVCVSAVASPPEAAVIKGAGTFAPGSQQTLIVRRHSGWLFQQWQDGNTNNPRVVIVPATNVMFVAQLIEMPPSSDPPPGPPPPYVVKLDGLAGTTNLIQFSTNLVEWYPLVVVTNSTGWITYTDAVDLSCPSRFYRTLSVVP